MNISQMPKVSYAFPAELFLKLKSSDENLFFSPVSILAAFSMVLAGAKNKSSIEIKKALHLDPKISDTKLHTEIGKNLCKLVEKATPPPPPVDDEFDDYPQEEDVTIKVANRAFIQAGYPLLDAFVKILKDSYKVEMGMLDFNDTTKSASEVNKWVAEQTNQKIKDMMSASSLSPDTRLVLVNAIYFKGEWINTFTPEATEQQPFKLSNGSTVQVPMMSTDGHYGYAVSKKLDCTMVALDFVGNRFFMAVILPNKVNGLPKLESELTTKDLENLLKKDHTSKAINKLSIPKFRIESSLELSSGMQKLGVKSVFDQNAADLSGMSSAERLFVSQAVHKAFLDVNEHGCEAAASTAISIQPMCLFIGEIDFVADHPFLVAIVDKVTGSLAFMGRVTDPSK